MGQGHRKVTTNPIDRFELLRRLNGAEDHDPELARCSKLGATAGKRRGELSVRRDRLRLDRAELVVDTAINDADGIVVEKPTKTHPNPAVSLDPVTISLLREHLADMDQRAATCGVTVAEDGFVQSRPRLPNPDATRAHDPPHAPTTHGPRHPPRRVRRHHPCATQLDQHRADGRRVQPGAP